MTYNHKSQPKTATETAFIEIDEIQRKPIKDGTAHIITLCGKKGGERYTAFERVWLE